MRPIKSLQAPCQPRPAGKRKSTIGTLGDQSQRLRRPQPTLLQPPGTSERPPATVDIKFDCHSLSGNCYGICRTRAGRTHPLHYRNQAQDFSEITRCNIHQRLAGFYRSTVKATASRRVKGSVKSHCSGVNQPKECINIIFSALLTPRNPVTSTVF
jgi:hypothetical protein